MKKGIWCYCWNTGSYTNGVIIGFKTKKKALIHANKKYMGDFDDPYLLEYGEIEEIYTGE